MALRTRLLSKTCIRLLARSATYTLPFPSTASPCGVLNWLGSDPGLSLPTCLRNLPFLSYFPTLWLTYPSDIKMFPCGSQPTSVGRPSRYFSAGGAGPVGGGRGPPTASDLRPITITTRPAGLNLMTMFVPSSTAQILSSGSTRTLCANSKPYNPSPLSLRYVHL